MVRSLQDAFRDTILGDYRRGQVYWLASRNIPISSRLYEELGWERKTRPYVVIVGDEHPHFKFRKTVLVAPCSATAEPGADAVLQASVAPPPDMQVHPIKKGSVIQLSLMFPMPKTILNHAECVGTIHDPETFKEIDLALARIFGSHVLGSAPA